LPGVGHRWHTTDLRAERLLELASSRSGGAASTTGLLASEGDEAPFETGHAMLVPKGIYQEHANTGTEPLKLLLIYTSRAALPNS
jgi:hypothetical protein